MSRLFLASMDQLHEILHYIRMEIQSAGFQGTSETQLELALEEAIVNIIKYAYPESEGNIEIRCTSLKPQGIKVVLIDNGTPFDPTAKISKKELEEIKKIPLGGGYGIFLIYRIMDDVEYEFKDGCNILSLTKLINS